MNEGKRFEQNIKASVPDDIFYYRFKDGTANFAGAKNKNVRFQAKNICDCMLFDDNSKTLVLVELKSHKGKSIPFSCIRDNQLNELANISLDFGNIYAGFIINLRDLDQTYWIDAGYVKMYVELSERKSIPKLWLDSYGTKIGSEKLKVNYRYDIKSLIKEMIK